ncbi:MAG TPA: UDP-N-acetylmuramoyl-L-alanyl-D-glutamate--2,6-diaminopimelate ligase [Bacteroidales bacterium]|nr:UDP-N-acetylmuramoyl-L-alanyl-D-glutamate--2,6-diaminopimelate ligase [Bacteroidales bacterium]
MVELGKILDNIKLAESIGSMDRKIMAVRFDSRKVGPDELFVAARGTRFDGHDFIDSAVKNGASVIICEVLPEKKDDAVTWIRVNDSAKALGQIASNFFGNPSGDLKVVGITGTNGKTTVATLLYETLLGLGFRTGLISTITNFVNNKKVGTTHTTPDPVELNRLFKMMVEDGCEYAFMEVSSHAIIQRRTEGIHFVGGVFTNLTHDHLDYHGTFGEYLNTKRTFFDNLGKQSFALVNIDDKNGKVMLQNYRGKEYSYALHTMSDYKAKVLEDSFEGMMLRIDANELSTRFIGEFNAYNLLAVYAVSNLLGIDRTEALTTISKLKPVRGRLEIVHSPSGTIGIVDYAHTPDAIENVISAINRIRGNGMKLIVVLGAGGDRDRSKRPVMAQVAAEGADRTILTSDNSRNEDPEKILDEMMAGIKSGISKKVLRITDRREAIRKAVSLAGSNDIILVAGKGHETYQEVRGRRYHFDDVEELRNCFE